MITHAIFGALFFILETGQVIGPMEAKFDTMEDCIMAAQHDGPILMQEIDGAVDFKYFCYEDHSPNV